MKRVSNAVECLWSVSRSLTIVVIPLPIKEVLRRGSVVATTQASKVVVHSKKIIQILLAVLLLADLRRQIKTLNRIINLDIDLVSEAPCATEALQVHDDNVRASPDLEGLGGLAQFLAVVAVPGVVFGELFALSGLHEAVFEGDAVFLAQFAALALGFCCWVVNEW